MPRPGPASQNVSLGESALVLIGEANLCVMRATITESPGEIPTTCTGNGGFTSRTRGPRDCTIDIEAQWKWEENPFTNPPSVEPGEDILNIKIVPDKNDESAADFWSFPVAYCVTRSVVIDAQGVQTWTMQLKNQGPFYTPSRANFSELST